VATALAPAAPRTRAAAPGRVLVVIGGLPGSGKTTLLRRVLPREVPGTVRLDSEDVATRLRAVGVRIPYRLLRPLVHVLHRWRVLGVVGSAVPVAVLTDPWTSAVWRGLVLWAAGLADRPVRVVLLDASPELARSGQAARGRRISDRRMRRHAVRWDRLLRRSRGAALVVDRREADRLTAAELLGA
jgi:predicted kinase